MPKVEPTPPVTDLERGIADAILEYVEKHDNVSFAELHRHIPGFQGTSSIRFPVNEAVIVWDTMSEEAALAVTGLISDKKMHLMPSSFFVYLCDGVSLSLPIAKHNRIKSYKKLHWAPCVLRPGAYRRKSH